MRCIAKTLNILVLILLIFSSITPSQTEEKDKADAIREAKKVARFMQVNRDVRPMLRRFAVKGFMKTALDDDLFNAFALLKEDLHRSLDTRTQEAFYVAATNFYYLSLIYNVAKMAESKQKPDGNRFLFPAQIEKIMEDMPIMRFLLPGNEEKRFRPSTPDEVRKAVRDFERVNVLLRHSTSSTAAKPYRQFQLNYEASVGGDFKSFETEVGKCDELNKCPGLPDGTRLIWMSFPGFLSVNFARVNGRMKIMHISIGPGD